MKNVNGKIETIDVLGLVNDTYGESQSKVGTFF